MARNDVHTAAADKARLLRALAFQIHRKQLPDEVLQAYFDEQFQLGRRREFRSANDALRDQGFAAALHSLGMMGDDAALLLAAIVESKDHRLLAAVLNTLADHAER